MAEHSSPSRDWPLPIEGGCACGALRYRLDNKPLVIHCCNCHQCQRETGSAFALNLVVEAAEVKLTSRPSKTNGEELPLLEPVFILMPSASGKGQIIARCPKCFVAVWSHYAGSGPLLKFVRGGTLDKVCPRGRSVEDVLCPDRYIFTSSKMPWVVFPEGAADEGRVTDEYYDTSSVWSEESLERMGALQERVKGWKERGSRWDELGQIVECR